MNEILSTLNLSGEAVIKTDELPEFWKHLKTVHDLYSLRYEYDEDKVKIIQTKETIFRIKQSHE